MVPENIQHTTGEAPCFTVAESETEQTEHCRQDVETQNEKKVVHFLLLPEWATV